MHEKLEQGIMNQTLHALMGSTVRLINGSKVFYGRLRHDSKADTYSVAGLIFEAEAVGEIVDKIIELRRPVDMQAVAVEIERLANDPDDSFEAWLSWLSQQKSNTRVGLRACLIALKRCAA